MSVRPKHYRRTPVVASVPVVVAADLVKADGPHNGEIVAIHPLSGAFLVFLGDNKPTKRQAAKFLATYPHYRAVVEAA